MIPLRLSLRNFLCYRDNAPTLELEDVHLACLCGPNGHGKSALLDAICWALWGQARGKSQDELVHQGQEEMLVELEFLARGQRYRVIRRHARPRRSRQGTTDLQLHVQANGGFHAITGNTIRETEARIRDLLGMDYETFINSAFLLQGRADEFTTKRPAERKEVLGKILGLSLYDRLEDRAKGQARETEDQARVLEAQIQQGEQEVARKGEYQAALQETQQALEQVTGQLKAQTTETEALRLRAQELERLQQEARRLEERLPAIEEEARQLQSQASVSQQRIQEYEALLAQQQEVRAGYQRLTTLREQYEALNQALAQVNALAQRRASLEQVVAQARTKLEVEQDTLQRRVEEELRPRALTVPTLEEERRRLRQQQEELAAQEGQVKEQRSRLQELLGQIQRLQALTEQLKTEGLEVRAKLDLLEHTHDGARCPLCNTELGLEGRQRLAQSYQTLIQERRNAYRENEASLQRLDTERQAQEALLARLEQSHLQAQQELQERATTLERDLEEAQQIQQLLQEVEARLERLGRQLQEKGYAPEEQGTLNELESQLAALSYDPEVHQQVRQELEQHQPFEERHRLLEQATASLPGERETLASLQAMARRREQELQEAGTRLEEAGRQLQELPGLMQRLSQAQESQRALEVQREELQRQQGALEEEMRRCQELEREVAARKRELRRVQDERAIYQTLAQAFGKKGVQAMLIEAVLPELEDEANLLLGRMTDNRMHLKLETQRERRSQKGEPIETLEIQIADELGSRSYELFSGGEAFRINLALRIALSKILARRKGAPLPTLFIDEGFGTQDAPGRERVLEVIRAIEDDFEKLIVITHLDEVKEAFPVRIEVQKTERGSTFWMS
ncbi:MAG: SbcC/MukB-like Walker B domain-containing protein [Dehalococcoidia bacterium]